MPSVGEQLRAAREARKLTIQQVAETTNMRTDHVVALEEGNYTPFPAPVYIRGSIRTYAKLLKLDVMPLMDQLTAEMNRPQGAEDQPRLPGHRRGFLDFLFLQLTRFGWKRSIVIAVLLLAILILILIKLLKTDSPSTDPLSGLPPPSYQPSGSDGGYLPLPPTNR